MRKLLVILIVVGQLFAAIASAQSTPPARLRIGDRVRITTADKAPVIGRLALADDSELVLVTSEQTRMAPAEERSFDRRSVVLIERSEGYRSKMKTGAIIGGVAGVGFGAFAGWAAAMSNSDQQHLVTGPVVWGGIGLVAGAAVGAAFSKERWRMVPSDSRLGLQVGASANCIAMGVRANF